MIKGERNGNGNFLCVWAGLLALALFPLSASAQGTLSRNTAGGHLWTATGTTYTTGVLSGSPVPGAHTWTLPAGSATGTALGNASINPNAGNTAPEARWRSNVNVPGSNGRSVPVDVKTPIDKAAAAKAIGRFAGSFLGPLSAGIALYDLAIALGLGVEPVQDGTPGADLFEMQVQCNSPGCYWQAGASIAGSAQAACNAERTRVAPSCPNVAVLDITGPDDTQGTCNITSASGSFCAGPGVNRYGNTVSVKDPISAEELEAKINAAPSWPAGAARGLRDALDKDPGNSVTVGTPTVTGPATTPGPVTTTSEPIKDGTGATIGTKTTTATTTYNNTYNGNTVNISNSTVTTTTNTYNNGAPTTTTTTTTTTEPPKPEPPEDPCVKNPDRVGCKTIVDPGTENIPSSTENLTYSPEVIGLGDGSCPAPVTFSTRAGTHQVSYQRACDFVTTYMRPVALLIGALMALFILMPGKPEA